MEDLRTEVRNALDVLKKGGIILYPTDTVWGIGCDATNEKAVQRILDLKGRTAEKGLVLLVDSEGRIPTFVKDAPQVAFDLIEYSEKPLTIVFDNAQGLAPSVIATDGSAAIRVTRDTFCQQLTGGLRRPVVSTSANLSNQPFPKRFSDIPSAIRDNVDYIVNLRQDETSTVRPSKIIRIRPNGEIKILRG